MDRYHLRIVLLGLGVVFGYGSAIAHFVHHRGHDHSFRHHWHEHCDEPSPTTKSGS